MNQQQLSLFKNKNKNKNYISESWTRDMSHVMGIRQQAVMGQVPQKIVQAAVSDDLDIAVNDEDDEDRDLHPQAEKSPKYLNPSKNPHGRVIYNPNPLRNDWYEKANDIRLMKTTVESYGSPVRMFMGNDIVSFMHPVYPGHEVLCDSLNKAKLWLQFYVQEKEAKNKPKEAVTDKINELKSPQEQKTGGLSIKPLSDLMAASFEVRQIDSCLFTF